jgi:hypothetical protein
VNHRSEDRQSHQNLLSLGKAEVKGNLCECCDTRVNLSPEL